MARVRAILRRAQPAKALPDELRFDDVVINFVSYEARKAGSPSEMTRKEFQILRLLASRPGEVVTRDELLNEVWGYENYPTTRTVDNHIAALRAKTEARAVATRSTSKPSTAWATSWCSDNFQTKFVHPPHAPFPSR